jgi:general secretion pathway protein G
MQKDRGFSLVELLVVIAIIAILASIIIANLSSPQEKARDARRLEDVRELQKALGLYDVSHGVYPVHTSTTTLTGDDPVIAALIAEGYLPAAPKDPASPATDYTYRSNALGSNYWIGFCLETDQIKNFHSGCGNIVSP